MWSLAGAQRLPTIPHGASNPGKNLAKKFTIWASMILFIAAHLYPRPQEVMFSRTQTVRSKTSGEPSIGSAEAGEPSTPSTIGLLGRHTGISISIPRAKTRCSRVPLLIKTHLQFVPSRRPWREYHNPVSRVQFRRGLPPRLMATPSPAGGAFVGESPRPPRLGSASPSRRLARP